jgi:hypothetical protein
VLEKNYLQQRDKVSTCMVKIGQESLTWKAEIMKLLQLTANKELSSKANDTDLRKEIESKYKSD